MPKIKRTINYVPSINYLQTLAKKQFVNVISDSIQNLYTQMLEIIAAIDNVNVDNLNIDIQSLVNINTDTGNWIINGIDTGISAKGKPGDTPIIAINNSGYWTVNGVSTGVKAQGIQGEPGNSITVSQTKAYYAKSNSNVQPNDNLFSETFPTLDLGDYLWTKNVVTFSDSESLTFYTVTRVPNNGSAGRGISSINISYATNSSPSQAPTGNNVWFSYANMPSVTPGDYLWTRIIFNYTDNTDSSSTPIYSVTRFGENGSPEGGSSGAQAMTISPQTNNGETPTINASPNVLHRLDSVVTSITVNLTAPSTATELGEYVFRFKTKSNGLSNPFFTFKDSNGTNVLTNIKYPFDYIINANTEYEVVLTYDGLNYVLNYCAYQSNT